MAFSHVLSELGTGLRRNVSMTVSLVVTLLVSLSLVGVGLLLQMQIGKTEAYWGDRLQIQVQMCSPISQESSCINGEATDDQVDQIGKVIEGNPDVESYYLQSSREAYDKARELFGQSDTGRRLFEALRPESFGPSYWVTLDQPDQADAVANEVSGLPGVELIRDLRSFLAPLYDILEVMRWVALGTAGVLMLAAVMQVANTIRLAAYARRREIGIMRLVGASSWHIQLPFVLESLLAAVLGAVLAAGVLAGFMQFLVNDQLTQRFAQFTPWVSWSDMLVAAGVTSAFAVVVAVLPTLVMTRKYLDV
ncbi:MAG: FtsX-like permease family protein [Nocardioidaceae bacterium]|nr:FtsX-like permease family protein [Nocardioidaceae bacterium]